MLKGYIQQLGENKRAGADVLLAMSGGVDSAASAVLLQQAGFRVVGLTMKNYCYGDVEVPERSCCSMEAIEDARSVCDRLDIQHMVVNTEDIFGREVYDNFLAEYSAWRTPNPCVRCNSVVRFETLADYADRMGIEYYATGHYARIFRSAADDKLFVARPRHLAKDQSYFLSGLRNADLERVLFPLGEHQKSDVRGTAKTAALDVAEKPESQEVCFIPEGTLREFLDGKIPLVPGPIEDTAGNIIGRHEGLTAYTIGQRRGLGVATGQPAYVIRLDSERNTLVIGDESELVHNELSCRLNWIDEVCLRQGTELMAQIRSRHGADRVDGVMVDGESARVRFVRPQRAIAPGQTIAFYTSDVVVGSGVIETAGPL